jgi:COP9 signalosome complex subunit 7
MYSTHKKQTLPYKDLMEALGFTEISDLESIIIDTIYNGAIQGRLDQRHMQLHIEYAIGRDLAPGELENVAKELDHWCQRIEVVLRDLDERIKQVQEATLANVSTKAEFNRQFETAMDVALSSSMRTDTDTMMSDVRTK